MLEWIHALNEGNPQARNLFEMVAYLQKLKGTVLEVHAATAA